MPLRTKLKPESAAQRRDSQRKHPLDWATFIVATLGLVAAGFAASFAYDQVLVARESAQRQLRAYVVVRPEDEIQVTVGSPIQAKAIIENLGQTPVYEFMWGTALDIAEFPLGRSAPLIPSCAEISSYPGAQRIFFGKDAPFYRSSPNAVTAQQMSALVERKAAVYFTGRACYSDIYRKQHHIDFCAYWRFENGKFGSANYCQVGNDSDR